MNGAIVSWWSYEGTHLSLTRGEVFASASGSSRTVLSGRGSRNDAKPTLRPGETGTCSVSGKFGSRRLLFRLGTGLLEVLH